VKNQKALEKSQIFLSKCSKDSITARPDSVCGALVDVFWSSIEPGAFLNICGRRDRNVSFSGVAWPTGIEFDFVKNV
jgi:hypothetical protein